MGLNMEIIIVLLIAALVFGICFLLDKGFQKVFRSKPEHSEGKAVRHKGRTAAFGLIVATVGAAALLTAKTGGWLYGAGGALLILVGALLVAQYMTFGVFYGEESFLYTTFGKRSLRYTYGDIRAQQLYNNRGHIVIELHMQDGSAIMLQSGMDGVYPFMDHAYAAWLRQTDRDPESCSFHHPENSCWFPPLEE